MLVMMLIFLVQFARVRFALDHTFIMLRFFKPLTTHEQQEQVKVTAVQAAAAVATAAAAKHQRDLLLPKPGRPRSLVNLVAPSSIPDPEPASKRPKQYKDWFTSDAIHHILESYRRNNYSSFRTRTAAAKWRSRNNSKCFANKEQ
jgi:hypothetical protein